MVWTAVFLLTLSVSAQKHIENYDPEALFNEGVLLFQNQEFGAALSTFTQYRAQVTDAKSQRCVDAQYYEAVSSLYLGQADGPAKVVQFVNDNPGSTWAKHANFLYANNLFLLTDKGQGKEIERYIRDVLNRLEALYIVEDYNRKDVWWGSLPGLFRANLTPPQMSFAGLQELMTHSRKEA